MYRKTPENQLAFEDFYLPFGGKLSRSNRWVHLARMIPWDLAEGFYAEQFSPSPQGAPAKSARLALGTLIIKESLVISDEDHDVPQTKTALALSKLTFDGDPVQFVLPPLAFFVLDTIYRARDNYDFCKKHGIHMSGRALGPASQKDHREHPRTTLFLPPTRFGTDPEYIVCVYRVAAKLSADQQADADVFCQWA